MSEEKIENMEDWDFDHSIYESDIDDQEENESLNDIKRPRITSYRSKYSNSMAELERLADLNRLLTQYGIKVSARTQDKQVLWKFYGILDEYWESISHIFGSMIHKEMNKIRNTCYKLLESDKGGAVDLKVHRWLLYFRSKIYTLRQFGKLGLEVEKIRSSIMSKSKSEIVQ